MQKLLFACLLLLPLSGAHADTLAMSTSAQPAVGLPTKGMSMHGVQQHYGAPLTQHSAVGGGSPKQPPITRWDYQGFSVFFERGTVVDAVTPGAPAPLQHSDELSSAP